MINILRVPNFDEVMFASGLKANRLVQDYLIPLQQSGKKTCIDIME